MNWYLGSYGKSIKGSLGKVKIIMAESCQKKAQAPSEKPAQLLNSYERSLIGTLGTIVPKKVRALSKIKAQVLNNVCFS